MHKDPNTPVSSRINKLDSVRGFAALMVVIGHTLGHAVGGRPDLWWLQILWDALDAVPMFFLLSGYVLALQLTNSSKPTYTGFLIRRVCRIWPAFAVALIATFLLLSALHWAGLSTRLPLELSDPSKLSLRVLALNLLMATDALAINPPVWSLFVEMRISIVFPLILVMAVRTNLYLAVLVGILFSVLVSRLVNANLGELINDIAATSRFVCLFVVGAALARHGNPCEKLYARLPRCARGSVLVLAVALMEYRFWPDQLPAQNYIPWIGVTLLFIICLYSAAAERFLDRREFIFVGRISYSLYLVHYPILLFFLCTTPDFVPSWLIVAAVPCLSILTAWALYVWVEKPMMVVGRNLSPPARLP